MAGRAPEDGRLRRAGLDVLGCQAEVISLDPSSLDKVLDGLLQVRSPAWVAEDEAVMSMSFSPDGSVLATAGSEGTATLWNVGSRSESARR
jgi:WD40 repeat protein